MLLEETTADRPPRLLIVEDDAGTRDYLARYLEMQGCAVSAVDAAEEGIVEASEVQFDAVVADIHLPGLSGIDLAGYLLSQDPGLPIILITGDPDESLARDALSRGPVQYLLKPFAPVEMEAAVRLALGRRSGPTTGSAEAPADPDLQIPADWLEFVDQHSYAGPGHAERVVRIAGALLAEMPTRIPGGTESLGLAARMHEVGRLGTPDAEPVMMALASAELMSEAGFPRTAVSTVRHMYERWNGGGGPDGLAGSDIPVASLILAAADALDHYASAWMRAGLNDDNAIDRAIHLVTGQQGSVFSPAVVVAVHRQRDEIRATCTELRADDEAPSITTATFLDNLAGAPVQPG